MPRRRSLIAVLLVLLAVSVGLRFRGLDHDLAYEITSYSGSFITDEGWYNKSARSLALWGEWGHGMDRNIYSHTSLFALWMAGVFQIFGVSLEVARMASIAAFLLSLGCLYLICRTCRSVETSLAACLAVSATLHVVTFSRMAIVEPTGVAVSLLALWLWIRYPANLKACMASVTLASCAVFLKVAFLFTPAVVAGLWLADALGWTDGMPRTSGERRIDARALRLITAVGLIGVLAVLALLGVRLWAGRDWHEMQDVAVYEQTTTVSLRASLNYQVWSVEEHLFENPERFVLFIAAAMMFGALLLPWTARDARRRASGRAWLAMAIWAVAGFVLFSMFEYRVPRYYYFLTYPLAFLALEGASAFFAQLRRRQVAFAVLALHLAVQIPTWGSWLARGPSASQAEMARAVATRITGDASRQGAAGDSTEAPPPVLLGLNAAFVAFFDPRIRPLEWEFVPSEVLCRRIDWWRPPYFLTYVSLLPEDNLCPELIRELQPLDYHTVMGRWYYDSDVVLTRIVYRESVPARGPRATFGET